MIIGQYNAKAFFGSSQFNSSFAWRQARRKPCQNGLTHLSANRLGIFSK